MRDGRSVRHKLRQLSLNVGPSIFGEGLLDRARSISFALLGASAAVGFAMIAIVLQVDWPLVAGSPVPPVPARQEAIGNATAVRAAATPRLAGTGVAQRRDAGPSAGHPIRAAAAKPAAPAPAVTTQLVVAPTPPTKSGHGGSPGDSGGSDGVAAPPSTTPTPAPATPNPPAESPAPQPSTPAPVETPPPVAANVPPPESHVPPGSNGNGHAYDQSGASHGNDHGYGDPTESPGYSSPNVDPHGYSDPAGSNGYGDRVSSHGQGHDD